MPESPQFNWGEWLNERDSNSGDNQQAIAQKLDGTVVAVNLGERSAPLRL
jgi:hypothetical protein